MASYKIQNVSEVYKIWFNCYLKKNKYRMKHSVWMQYF
jgi:hypothetical protein